MKTKFKLLKKMSVLLSLLLTFSLLSTSLVYAQSPNVITRSNDNVMSLDGPTVYVDLGELGHSTLQRDAKGNYSGKLNQVGASAITCLMTGGIDSITNKYEIGIRWTGTELVNSIKADKLTVSSGSTKYWSNSFAFNTGTSAAGYRPIGYVVIPPDVKKVKIKTKGLQCYFNDADFWIRLNEINGSIKLK